MKLPLRACMALVTGIAMISACAPEPAADAAEAPAPVAPRDVVIRTKDYAFTEVPVSLEAGLTNFRLVNEGPDFHHVWLVRLDEGHTVDELMQSFAAGGPPPAWAVDMGGPNTPGAPGGETNAIVDLTPGSYAMLCVIPAMADGQLHVMKGMVAGFTVTESTAPAASLPEADIVLRMNEYAFGIDSVIPAGTHTFRVENAGAQPHEVLFVKLEPGKTPEDFARFVEPSNGPPQGPPPGLPIGGTTGMASGQMNQITLNLEPGEYGLLCFVPDAADGKPHVLHGMSQKFKVM